MTILNNAIEQNLFPLIYNVQMNKEKYRPINVFVCQSKMFECIMVDQLMQFMNGNVSDLLSTYIQGVAWLCLIRRNVAQLLNFYAQVKPFKKCCYKCACIVR